MNRMAQRKEKNRNIQRESKTENGLRTVSPTHMLPCVEQLLSSITRLAWSLAHTRTEKYGSVEVKREMSKLGICVWGG